MSRALQAAVAALVWGGLALVGTNVWAQGTNTGHGRYVPLDQYVPPGVAGQMALQAGKAPPHHFQPVRVKLPSTGTVTFFDGSPQRPVDLAAPAQAGLLVGRMYRLRVTDLPEFPGGEFYPSIELVDRLHPPPGQAERFPVEIELFPEEFAGADNGRMITKVVYLEQPDLVQQQHLHGEKRVVDLAPVQNALAEADVLGRPIAIVRMGGRTPDRHLPDLQFWGPSSPIQITVAANPQTRFQPHRNPIQPVNFTSPQR
ncbi:MAG TPA: hypothetical protein VFG20_02665 [Planctomycetaceae bacterium]|nr:hypothetical protein [Planctomycetaceae bacterium]